MKKMLCLAGSVLLSWGCQSIPEPVEKSYYISASGEENLKRNEACSFRYKIENSFKKLDNQLQQQAVRAAFDLWQHADPNILFLQKQESLVAEIIVRFEPLAGITKDTQISSIGLIRGELQTLSSFQQDKKNYIISLDSEFNWDTRSLTRVISYHIGKFLGLKDSKEKSSVLYPVYLDQSLKLSQEDSLQLNKLYNKSCQGGCNNFLPMSLALGGLATRAIRIDQPGKITVTSTGSMIVGIILGWSTPDGLAKGLFNIPIGNFSIERAYNHAAVLYKLNNEPNWKPCYSKCEFETDGISQCLDLTLAVNDIDTTDNQGTYSVIVDYKK